MADEKYIKLSDAKDEFYYTLADKDCTITDYKQAYEILDGVEAADVRPVARDTPHMQDAIDCVIEERRRQIALWGDQSGTPLNDWTGIIGEEFGELCEAINESTCENKRHPELGGVENIYKEASHVAATAIQLMEAVLAGFRVACCTDMREN